MPTLRQTIGELLKSGPQSARTISQAVAVREREVYDHLDHIARSAAAQGQTLIVTPARCTGCGFLFKERQRLKPPGRCPVCKQSRIQAPLYQLVLPPHEAT